jgi:hypothetical protein
VNTYLGVHGYSIYETILGKKKDWDYELQKRISKEAGGFDVYESPEIIQECIEKFENNIVIVLNYVKNVVEEIKTLRKQVKIDVLEEDLEDAFDEIDEDIDIYIKKINYLSEDTRIDDDEFQETIERYFDYINLVSFAPHFGEAVNVLKKFNGQYEYFSAKKYNKTFN